MPYWRLFYHVVWSTKHRLPLIEAAWEEELYGYIWGKATSLECIPHAINGTTDHTHVVISIPPKLSVATVIGHLKGASSHRMNEVFVANRSYPRSNFHPTEIIRCYSYWTTQRREFASRE